MISKPFHVHFTHPLGDDERATLTQHLVGDVLITDGALLPDPATYDLLVDGRPRPAQIEASPHLRALLIPFAGLPPVTRTLMLGYPQVAVHNLHHNAHIVAEFAFGMLLAAAKDLARGDRELRRGDWSLRYRDDRTATLLAGKTALILGYGAIGSRVADYCRAFGMLVAATKNTLPPDKPDFLHPPTDLLRLLPSANALIIALPHTPDTDGLLGGAELALLPPRAILVNVGRAAIVDQTALYEALVTGRLGAAASDVWWHYPPDEAARTQTLPADLPFQTLDNFTLSPHRAGHVDATEAMRFEHVAMMINALRVGPTALGRVDLARGY